MDQSITELPAKSEYDQKQQDFFTKTVQHLRKQNAKSLAEGSATACAYRGAEGRKCAIGVHITDKEYARYSLATGNTLEGLGCNSYQVRILDSLAGIDLNLASKLQRVHDQKPVEAWEMEFKNLSTISEEEFGYKLEVPAHE